MRIWTKSHSSQNFCLIWDKENENHFTNSEFIASFVPQLMTHTHTHTNQIKSNQ
jgi:hypothetical protein